MSIVEEGGKVYRIDDKTGLVSQAAVKEADQFADEYRLGDRVEVPGLGVGSVISLTSSVYGLAFGVKFDNGMVDEFGESQLKKSTVEAVEYESPVEEIYARFASYQELPAYTEDERVLKQHEASWLNLKASSLNSQISQAGVIDRKLDSILLVTGSDLHDLKEIRESAENEENQRHQNKFNQYSVASEISGMGAGVGSSGDASWLDIGTDGMEVAETMDVDLAARATEMVAHFNRDQLESDDFMTLAASYQNEYLVNDAGREKKFASYLDLARADRLAELKQEQLHKKASVEVDLSDNTDPAFLWGG